MNFLVCGFEYVIAKDHFEETLYHKMDIDWDFLQNDKESVFVKNLHRETLSGTFMIDYFYEHEDELLNYAEN